MNMGTKWEVETTYGDLIRGYPNYITYKISKLGSQLSTSSSGTFLKMRYAFLTNSNFVRVYKDNVLLTYGVDWDFNTGPKIGSVDDLTDGVKFLGSITPTSTYRLEVDERITPITPPIILWRKDGEAIGASSILYRTQWGTLTGLTTIDTFTYRATYSSGTVDHRYAERMGAGLFEKSASIPAQWGTGWRLEVYKIGAKRKNNRTGSPMNSTIVPVYQTSINDVDLTIAPFFHPAAIHSGHYLIRLRNTNTGQVTNFSDNKMFLRALGIRDSTFTNKMGHYFRSGVI